MRSLNGLGVRALTEHKGRAILLGAGITLGVALLTGSLVASASLSDSIERRYASRVVATPLTASISTSAAAGGLPSTLVDQARDLPAVDDAAPMVTFGTTVRTAAGKGTTLGYNQAPPAFFVGLAMQDADSFGLDVLDGRLPGDSPGEVAITRRLANSIAARPGDRLTLATPTGNAEETVVGIVGEVSELQQARAVVGTLETGQALGGAPGQISSILIRLDRGTDADEWKDAHRNDLGSAVTFDAPLESLARSLNAQLTGLLLALGLVMVLAGAYLVYLTISTRIVERVRLYGTLQALGATHRQVRRLVLTEAVALGLPASVVGVGLGVGIGSAILSLGRRQFVFGGGEAILVVPPWAIVLAVLVGTFGTAAATLVPARRAARLDPVSAMAETHAADAPAPRRWIVGPILAVVGVILVAADISTPLVVPIVLAGAILTVPVLLAPVARLLQPVVARASAGVGSVAVHHILRERRRASRTLGLMTLVLAAVVLIAGLYTSFLGSIDGQLDEAFRDEVVTLDSPSTFPASFVEDVEQLPGVAMVTPQAQGATKILTADGEQEATIRMIDPGTYFEVGTFSWVDGDDASAKASLASGGALLVPEAAAETLGLRRGTIVEVRTTEGNRPFTVAGTLRGLNSNLTLYMSYDDGRRYLAAGAPISLSLKLAEGADPDGVSQALVADLGDQTAFVVSDPDDLRDSAHAQLSGFVSPLLVVIGLGALLGLVGLANSMAMSMIERYREIGLLRALGAKRRQLRLLALVESSIIVLAALAAAVPLGLLLLFALLQSLDSSQIVFNSISFHMPWAYVPVLAVLAVAIAGAASLWPARHASRLEIDQAMRFE